jgi:hypothetical protein
MESLQEFDPLDVLDEAMEASQPVKRIKNLHHLFGKPFFQHKPTYSSLLRMNQNL